MTNERKNELMVHAIHTMTERLIDIKLGNVQWTVSNQFDESIITSALYYISAEHMEDRLMSAMDYAHTFSRFEVEELDSAWVN